MRTLVAALILSLAAAVAQDRPLADDIAHAIAHDIAMRTNQFLADCPDGMTEQLTAIGYGDAATACVRMKTFEGVITRHLDQYVRDNYLVLEWASPWHAASSSVFRLFIIDDEWTIPPPVFWLIRLDVTHHELLVVVPRTTWEVE